MGFSKRIESMLDLPEGALSGELTVELCGTRRVILDGECDILLYTDDTVCVRSKGQTLRVTGHRLTLESIGSGSMVLTGAIASVEFL